MKCDKCCADMINGMFCHEQGCENSNKVYDNLTGTWRSTKECFVCGSTVLEDCVCCEE